MAVETEIKMKTELTEKLTDKDIKIDVRCGLVYDLCCSCKELRLGNQANKFAQQSQWRWWWEKGKSEWVVVDKYTDNQI